MADIPQPTTTTSPSTDNGVFDGNTIDPQFAIALKLFLAANSPSAQGRSHASGSTSVSANTPEKAAIDTNDFAAGITWDATNKRFTIVTAGYYLVIAAIRFNSVTSLDNLSTYIYKNGSSVSEVVFHAGAAGQPPSLVAKDILNLAVNDYIEVYGNDDTHNCGFNSIDTFLAIAQV